MATQTVATRLPPRLGTKKVYLPNFTLTLLRQPPGTSPTLAHFLVPLNLNKLDLRDYLWNGYGVRVKAVRSYILQQKIRQDRPGAKRPAPRQWFRPKAIKKMMVELEEPFVWNEEVVNFEPWDKETFEAAQKERQEFQEGMQPSAKLQPTKERVSIASQARALLERTETWKGNAGVPEEGVWEDMGEEVEQDVHLPKD